MMIIADETDEAAEAKWLNYCAGADQEALKWLSNQSAANNVSATTNTPDERRHLGGEHQHGHAGRSMPKSRPCSTKWPKSKAGGVLLTFDDFLKGVEDFGTRIQPLMKTRTGVRVAETA
jgi:pyrimidine oxygenase